MARRPLILAYHGVDPMGTSPLFVEPRRFEWQMGYLRSRRLHAVALEALDNPEQDAAGPERVGLTFDDGYEDNYHHALPILTACGFTATIFLVTDNVGKSPSLAGGGLGWASGETGRILSWAQVREMADLGFRFGSHTCSHPDLRTLDAAGLARELETSKATIEDQTGLPVEYFCYPAGRVDERVVRAVEAAGYRGAVLTPRTARFNRDTRFTRLRTGIYRHNSALVFRIKISALYQRSVRWGPGFRLLRAVLGGER